MPKIKIKNNVKVKITPNTVIKCDSLPLPVQETFWTGMMNPDYSLVGNNFNFTNNLATLKSLIAPRYSSGNSGVVLSLAESRHESGLGTLKVGSDIQFVTGYDTYDFTKNYGGNLRFSNWPSVQYIYVGNHSLNTLQIDSCPSLHTFQSNDRTVTEVGTINCPSLHTVYLKHCMVLEVGNCPLLKNLSIIDGPMGQPNVDGLLHVMDMNNLTNGRIELLGNIAPPSAQGLIYKNNLVSRGYTVTHN